MKGNFSPKQSQSRLHSACWQNGENDMGIEGEAKRNSAESSRLDSQLYHIPIEALMTPAQHSQIASMTHKTKKCLAFVLATLCTPAPSLLVNQGWKRKHDGVTGRPSSGAR